jgi:hypothetical protein
MEWDLGLARLAGVARWATCGLIGSIVLLAGCSQVITPPSASPPSALSPMSSLDTTVPSPAQAPLELAVRTFPAITEINGTQIGCDAIGVDHPVFGHLAGDRTDPSVVWLVSPDRQRLEVLWPSGFFARFDPVVALHDRDRHLVANAGDGVLLQVPRAAARGTLDWPYLATGLTLAGPDVDPVDDSVRASYTGCYARRP